MRPVKLAFLLLLGCLAALPGHAMDRQAAYSMEILVDGRPLRELPAGARTYVEALEGREYSVRLSNRTGRRVAVALSVDGLNSISRVQVLRLGMVWPSTQVPPVQVKSPASAPLMLTDSRLLVMVFGEFWVKPRVSVPVMLEVACTLPRSKVSTTSRSRSAETTGGMSAVTQVSTPLPGGWSAQRW